VPKSQSLWGWSCPESNSGQKISSGPSVRPLALPTTRDCPPEHFRTSNPFPRNQWNLYKWTLGGSTLGDKHVVTLSAPYPLLDPGVILAVCTEATFAWARQWKKWMARLVLDPQNYFGRAYQGKLCKFLSLGRDPQRPFAAPQSHFRRLLVELNGSQPVNPEVDIQVFEGRIFEITVETVKLDRHGTATKPEHWYSTVREIHPAPLQTHQPLNTEPINPSTLRTQTTHLTDQHSNTENTPLAVAVQKRDSVSLKASGSK